MSGTNTTPKKRSFGFDDILSILDGKKTRPPARPALPASSDEDVAATKAAEQIERQEPPKVIALPEDHTLVPKLLSDIDQKNSEIIRLNNDLSNSRYELREKEFKLTILTQDISARDAKIAELQSTIEALKAEIVTLKAIKPQQPIIFAPPQQPAFVATTEVATVTQATPEPVTATPQIPVPQPAQPLQITQLLDAVQAANNSSGNSAQPVQPEAPAQVQADAASARPIKEQYTIKEEVVEEDVATIFRRLAKSRDEPAAEAGNATDMPRRPRSAKMYDL